MSSWSSNFLVLELYLLDGDGRENTENAVPFATFADFFAHFAVKCFTAKAAKNSARVAKDMPDAVTEVPVAQASTSNLSP